MYHDSTHTATRYHRGLRRRVVPLALLIRSRSARVIISSVRATSPRAGSRDVDALSPRRASSLPRAGRPGDQARGTPPTRSPPVGSRGPACASRRAVPEATAEAYGLTPAAIPNPPPKVAPERTRDLSSPGTLGNNAPFIGPVRHLHQDHPAFASLGARATTNRI